MKAIVVGDNLIPAGMILAHGEPLRAAGYTIQAFDWLATDRNELVHRNLTIEKHGPEAVPPPDGLAEAIQDAEVLITQFSPVPRAIVEAGHRLRIIGVARAGWENVAVEAATARGIPVVHVVGRNANAVAEHALGLILCEMRNVSRAHCAIKAGVWFNRYVDPHVCFELACKTVGLIGFGAIGRLLGHRLAGFDVRLLVYDPFVSEADVRELGGEVVTLEALLRRSDVVSLHARLSPETQGLIGRRELALMKPTAYLVNTARAGLIDQVALLEALQQHRIAGAALDVFWQEPLPADSPLLDLDNVTLSAHLAGTTLDALYASIDLVIKEVLAYLQQGRTEGIINQKALKQ
jgi:D-3-phosphoglycerate dehydrogenase